jgi:hypothetical protein
MRATSLEFAGGCAKAACLKNELAEHAIPAVATCCKNWRLLPENIVHDLLSGF